MEVADWAGAALPPPFLGLSLAFPPSFEPPFPLFPFPPEVQSDFPEPFFPFLSPFLSEFELELEFPELEFPEFPEPRPQPAPLPFPRCWEHSGIEQ